MGRVLFLVLLLLQNSYTQSSAPDKLHKEEFKLNAELADHIKASFNRRNIHGCFIIHDLKRNEDIVYNKERANQPFLPASTFKILNSMIALECEVIEDETEVIAWDGVDRSISIWNRDHNMKTGIKNSVVWFYQELARRIGTDRMQYYVNQVGYGNQQIGKNIDNFWLEGDLRITPMEQVLFLKRVIEEDLPFSKDNMRTVKEIMIEDKSENYIFRAKTGWADVGIPVGWYIGYIEINGSRFIFVNNIEIRSNEDASARKEITKEVIKSAFNIELKI